MGAYSSRGKPRRCADLPDAHAHSCRNRNQCLFILFYKKKLEKKIQSSKEGRSNHRKNDSFYCYDIGLNIYPLFLSLTSTIIDFDNPFFILVRHGFGWRRI